MKKIILILMLVFLISGCNNTNNLNEKLAKCIGEKSTLYISTGCSACNRQSKIFGENFKYLNKVNCVIESEKCRNAGITAVPTWTINGENYKGIQTIEKLKKLTKC